MSKEIILRWVRVFLKKYFGVGYVLEALQINSKKLFWGVTLVFLPMVARMFSMVFHYKSTILGVLPIYGEPKSPRFGDVKVDVSPGPLARCPLDRNLWT